MKTSTLFAVTLTAASLACSLACDGYVEEGTPEAEACEHAVDGPANAVTASSSDDDGAPDVSAEHTRHDVTLVALPGDEGNGGFVRLESEGGEHIVFLTVDVPLAFAQADGTAIEDELVRDETTCAEVVTSHHVELPVGIVSIGFGPTPETSVSIVIEPTGAHEDE
jgi:hypothetical protein